MLSKILDYLRSKRSSFREFRYVSNYYGSGRKPWNEGYYIVRRKFINDSLSDGNLEIFKKSSNLPVNYGYGIDERVVEYPFIFSKIIAKHKRILDAGSSLNYQYCVSHKKIKEKNLLISNLNVESNIFNSDKVSYLYGEYGDLRNLPLKDNVFDLVICCSVLEHVGMDNTKHYVKNSKSSKILTKDYLKAIDEFKRVLKEDGECIITVPYGKYRNFGWFQQFDKKMIRGLVNRFAVKSAQVFYKYGSRGWQVATQSECDSCVYSSDLNSNENLQVAAGSVACLHFFLGKK